MSNRHWPHTDHCLVCLSYWLVFFYVQSSTPPRQFGPLGVYSFGFLATRSKQVPECSFTWTSCLDLLAGTRMGSDSTS